jgi:hypothetical protein
MTIRRSKALDQMILERLAEGELVTVLCRDNKMPSIRQLQRWRRDDATFDDACWSSEGQGLMVQRSDYIEQMMAAVKEGGPGSSTAIQGLRELMSENGRTAGRLVARMNDRAHLHVDGQVDHAHIVVGWQDGFECCPECGYSNQPDLVELEPNRPPVPSGPVNGRDYVDYPKQSAPSAAAPVEKSEPADG